MFVVIIIIIIIFIIYLLFFLRQVKSERLKELRGLNKAFATMDPEVRKIHIIDSRPNCHVTDAPRPGECF